MKVADFAKDYAKTNFSELYRTKEAKTLDPAKVRAKFDLLHFDTKKAKNQVEVYIFAQDGNILPSFSTTVYDYVEIIAGTPNEQPAPVNNHPVVKRAFFPEPDLFVKLGDTPPPTRPQTPPTPFTQ